MARYMLDTDTVLLYHEAFELDRNQAATRHPCRGRLHVGDHELGAAVRC